MRAFFVVIAILATLGNCFIPNSFYNFLAVEEDEDVEEVSGETHVMITRSAILNVSVDLLIDKPYNEGSRSRIMSLVGSDFDEKDLLSAYFGESRKNVRMGFKNAIEVIENTNSEVDDREGKDAGAHFYSEMFQLGQNRLYELRQIVIDLIRTERFEDARIQTGRMLHTLQDFYSHSNWVEMGKTEPNDLLGTEERLLVAKIDRSTCTDCKQDGRSEISASKTAYNYICEGNLRNIGDLLTSGYYSGQGIEKPNGKCSHGGYRDRTADQPATGGINKDSPYPKLSPHHKYHYDAATIAEKATIHFLNGIRHEVNNERFGHYLNLFVQTVKSVAYVIDTTGSMTEELPQIQATIPQIRADLEEYLKSLGDGALIKYILVPFNDPDPGSIYETTDINEFFTRIGNLTADGGGDTSEPSIGALIRALKSSEEQSPILVFTDAPPSDSYRRPEAEALITQKAVSVHFVYVNGLRKRRNAINMGEKEQLERRKRQVDETYRLLSSFSGGQLLDVGTNDISGLGDLVSFTAKRGRTTILRQSGTSTRTANNITFHVDSTVEEVIISINDNDNDNTVQLYSPSGGDASMLPQYSVSLQSGFSFIATLTIDTTNLLGEWNIQLPVGSVYTVVVYAISDLIFTNQLYFVNPENSYGYSTETGKPLKGRELTVVFQANDRMKSISVERVNTLDSSGDVLLSSNDIQDIGDNAYRVKLTPPSVSFYLQIVGKIEGRYEFSRISDTAIEVSSIDLTLGDGESGYYTLRPGGKKTISINLFNGGNQANFTLSLNTSTTEDNIISANLKSSSIIIIDADATKTIFADITAPESASSGDSASYTLVAESTLDNSNDFVIFRIAVTTLPPSPFTDNAYGGTTKLSGVYVLILMYSVMVLLKELL